MKKTIAWFILTSIFLPFVAWASLKIINHAERITRNESNYSHIKESLSDLKNGQNEIRNYIINSK